MNTIDATGAKVVNCNTTDGTKERTAYTPIIDGKSGACVGEYGIKEGKPGKSRSGVERYRVKTNESREPIPLRHMYKQENAFVSTPVSIASTIDIFPGVGGGDKESWLIMDPVSSQVNPSYISILKRKGWHILLIPGAVTDYCQPLDVGVDKSFKNGIREKLDEFIMSQYEEGDMVLRKPSWQQVLRWCSDIMTGMSDETIYHSFICSGLSCVVPGSVLERYSETRNHLPKFDRDIQKLEQIIQRCKKS